MSLPALRLNPAGLRLPLILVGALAVQAGFEAWRPRSGTPVPWIVLLILVGVVVIWSVRRGDVDLEVSQPAEQDDEEAPVRGPWLLAGAILILAAFLLSGDNTFRTSTVVAWVGGVVSLMLAFWQGEDFLRAGWRRLVGWLAAPRLTVHLEGGSLAVLAALALGAYFRFSLIDQLPGDMWSDHAEKLLDVMDVLNGYTPIFFLRNTGREPLQFYLAAAMAQWLGTGISFLTLKLGTALAGFLTLPYLYLLAREFGGKAVGLAALALGGMAFWPNLIARAALRFAFLPVLAAPAVYYLVRSLRRRRRNDMILAGLFSGLALYGYSPARIVPIVILVGVLVYLAHPAASGRRRQTLLWLGLAGLIALAVFVPLLHAALTLPGEFLERSLTRLTSAERPLPGPALALLLGNVWNALTMFNWDSGVIWVVALPGTPSLDMVSGGLFLAGLMLLVSRYARRRSWLDLFVLTSILLFLAPSFMSLAFPEENPAPHRAGGAMLPVFLIAGFGLVTLLDGIRRAFAGRAANVLAAGLGLSLVAVAAGNNHRMMFDDYAALYRQAALNTGDAGRVIRGYADSIGSFSSAYVVPYPHWFDTRLVGFRAGRPGMDLALPAQAIDGLAGEPGPHLFLVHLADQETLDRLSRVFPHGRTERFISGVEQHDFWIFSVPPPSEAP